MPGFGFRFPKAPPSDPEFWPQGPGVKVEDLIMVSKDGKERKRWLDIAFATDENQHDIDTMWDHNTWENYNWDMEQKFPGLKLPDRRGGFWRDDNPLWERLRKKNAAPIYERTELTDDNGAYQKGLAKYKKADSEMKERVSEAMAREITESTGGRRRTKNAKYYIKRRGTKRRRSKRHRSKKHRA